VRQDRAVDWEWDPTLYEGAAPFYARGRRPYPPALATGLAAELGLDGTGRLLDVGCGPGPLTVLLAPLVAEAVGVDADAGMIAYAREHHPALTWVHLRAEELPAGLGSFRLVTFAQSFHWMDRERVAGLVRGMLDPGGALVHVGATTHQGIAGDVPWDAVAELVARYLGSTRRAGRGTLPAGTPGGESDVYRAAGFTGPRRFTVPGPVVERTADEVVAAVFSLSSSAPHLFGSRLAAFEADLRALLGPGPFTETMREIDVDVWAR
jgi:SAM-dependent methyltransferase